MQTKARVVTVDTLHLLSISTTPLAFCDNNSANLHYSSCQDKAVSALTFRELDTKDGAEENNPSTVVTMRVELRLLLVSLLAAQAKAAVDDESSLLRGGASKGSDEVSF